MRSQRDSNNFFLMENVKTEWKTTKKARAIQCSDPQEIQLKYINGHEFS